MDNYFKLVKKGDSWFNNDSPVIIRMTGEKFFLRTQGPVQANVRLDQFREYTLTFDGFSGVIANIKEYDAEAGWSEAETVEIPLDCGFLSMIHVTQDTVQ